MSGESKESKEFRIELDDDPNLFTFILNYLYQDQSITKFLVRHEAEYILLARLYIASHLLKRWYTSPYSYNTTTIGPSTVIYSSSHTKPSELGQVDSSWKMRRNAKLIELLWNSDVGRAQAALCSPFVHHALRIYAGFSYAV